MTSKFCINCGQQLDGNDKFCPECGATVEKHKNGYRVESEPTRLHNTSIATSPTNGKKHSTKNLKPLLLIPIILFSLAVPLIVVSSLGSIRTPLGTLDYEIPSMEYPDVELTIDNSVGFVVISYDASMDSLFEATIEVRGGIRASIDDAKNFEYDVVNNKTIISFDSEDDIFSFWSFKSLTHNIFININPNAVVDFIVHSSTGGVTLDLDDIDNVVMKDVELSSSTGSVEFHSGDAVNTTIEDINISASTGRVLFDFDNAIDTKVEKINFSDSTGNVKAHLGEAMDINSADVVLETSTGSVTLTFENLIFNEDTTWDVETSTGSITIEFIQTNILPLNFTSIFNVQTSTGSIVVDGIISTDLGLEITADTSTGSINLPSGYSYYSTTDYHLKDNQFSFTLLTSTGSITADIEN